MNGYLKIRREESQEKVFQNVRPRGKLALVDKPLWVTSANAHRCTPATVQISIAGRTIPSGSATENIDGSKSGPVGTAKSGPVGTAKTVVLAAPTPRLCTGLFTQVCTIYVARCGSSRLGQKKHDLLWDARDKPLVRGSLERPLVVGDFFSSHEAHVWTMIAGHVGVSVAAFVLWTWIDAGFRGEEISPDKWIGISQQLCVLGMGTTGGIFVSTEIAMAFSYASAVILAWVFLFDLGCAVFLARISQSREQHRHEDGPISLFQAFFDLGFGVATVMLACALIYVGLNIKNASTTPKDQNQPAGLTTPAGTAS